MSPGSKITIIPESAAEFHPILRIFASVAEPKRGSRSISVWYSSGLIDDMAPLFDVLPARQELVICLL